MTTKQANANQTRPAKRPRLHTTARALPCGSKGGAALAGKICGCKARPNQGRNLPWPSWGETRFNFHGEMGSSCLLADVQPIRTPYDPIRAVHPCTSRGLSQEHIFSPGLWVFGRCSLLRISRLFPQHQPSNRDGPEVGQVMSWPLGEWRFRHVSK